MATLHFNLGLTLSCAVLFIPSSTLLLGMRYYARRQQKAHLGPDDWLMIPAYILLLGMQITMIVAICLRELGYSSDPGSPFASDSAANLPFWPFLLQEVPALSCVKLSVLFFYRRVFNTGGTPYIHWSSAVMIAVVTAWTIAYFFTFLFLCGSHHYNYWISPTAEKAYCVKTQEVHLSFSISDMLLDIMVLLLAFPAIWKLQMSMSRRIAVTGIFALGAITVGASIARMIVFITATAERYDPNLNFEYLITSSMYWSMLECGLSFIGANLVLVYGLMVHSTVARGVLRGFRSLRSLIPSGISRHSEGSQDNYDMPYAPGQAYKFQTASSVERNGSEDIELVVPMNKVHITQQFGSTSSSAL